MRPVPFPSIGYIIFIDREAAMNRDETNGYFKCTLDDLDAVEKKISRIFTEGDLTNLSADGVNAAKRHLWALQSLLLDARAWNLDEKK